MTAAEDLPTRLREAAGLAVHHKPTPHRQTVCADCWNDVPCEASRMAEALHEAADEIERLTRGNE